MSQLTEFLKELELNHNALYIAAVKQAAAEYRGLSGLSDFASKLVSSVDKLADKYIKTKSSVEQVRSKVDALRSKKSTATINTATISTAKKNPVLATKESQIVKSATGFTNFEKISLGLGTGGLIFAGIRALRNV